MTEPLTAADDRFHSIASDDRWWTETCWFSFDQPGSELSATFYPLFRPNLGVCSLAVYVWDPSAHEPHLVRYGRSWWHLAMPTTPLESLRLEGLEYDAVEPLQRYRVAFRDGDRIDVDLTYVGLRAARPSGVGQGLGHLDQPCRVTGEVRLEASRYAIDSLAMRDRSWHVRSDGRSIRAGYTYGTASGDDQFLAVSGWDGASYQIRTGYLVRDGVDHPLVAGVRRVIGRDPAGYPLGIEIEATDAAGRRLEARGRCLNRLANPATPGLFAWMSMTAWDDGSFGEDQDIWSPDLTEAMRG